MRANWLCVGRRCRPIGRRRAHALRRLVYATARVLGPRATTHEWWRYAVSLAETAPPPAGVELVPLDDTLIARLRQHPEREHLATTFHIREVGLGRGFVWMDGEMPVCLQWIFTEADNAKLPQMDEWAPLYPPLPAGTGQVEGLYAFSERRRKGAATDFEFALYEQARRMGLAELVTHVRDDNEPTHRWAAKTGWTRIGTITRLTLDVRGLRKVVICVHSELPES